MLKYLACRRQYRRTGYLAAYEILTQVHVAQGRAACTDEALLILGRPSWGSLDRVNAAVHSPVTLGRTSSLLPIQYTNRNAFLGSR